MSAADGIKRLEQRAQLFAKTRAALFLAAAVALFILGRCSVSGGKTALPAPLAKQIAQHAVTNAVDSSEIVRLRQSATTAAIEEARAIDRANAARREAAKESVRAESLAVLANAAFNSAAARVDTTAIPDTVRKATAWLWAAYGARTHEADSLRSAVQSATSATAKANARGDSLDRALGLSQFDLAQTKTDLASAVRALKDADPPCHLIGPIGRCPSRIASATIGALAAGAAAITLYELDKQAKDAKQAALDRNARGPTLAAGFSLHF